MCTAISDKTSRHLFGRTLDFECSFGESVVVLPRNFSLEFLHGGGLNNHLAIIGAAHIEDGYPLFYDAANEAGLCGAALNFPGYAKYNKYDDKRVNLASAEILSRVLSEFHSVREAKAFLKNVNITDESIKALPPTPLHWIFADAKDSVTVEATERGLEIHDNPFGVLTNSPDFSYHLVNLSNYANLSPNPPKNDICKEKITFYSRGLGSFGLPGDYSSASRFVRAVFLKEHTRCDLCDNVGRFFHIMDSLSVPLGAVMTDENKPVSTLYTSCIDTGTRTYFYTTYKNREIRAVTMNERLADGCELATFSMDDSV